MSQIMGKNTANVAMGIVRKVVFFSVPVLGNWFVDEQFRKRIEWEMRAQCYLSWTEAEDRDIQTQVMQLVPKMEAEMKKTKGGASDGH